MDEHISFIHSTGLFVVPEHRICQFSGLLCSMSAPNVESLNSIWGEFREFAEWIKSTTKSAYKWFKLSFHIQSFLQMSLVSAYYSINLLFYVPKCRMPIANANEQKCRKYIYCMCWRMQSCLVNINVNQKAFGFHLVSIKMKCRPVVSCIRILHPSSTFSNRFFFQYPGEPSLRSIWIND